MNAGTQGQQQGQQQDRSQGREVLIRIPYPEHGLEMLRREYVVHYAPTPPETEQAIAAAGPSIGAAITNGRAGLSAAEMRAMPNLGIVMTRGVGYENVDLDVARQNGVVVCNGHGVNSFSVSEHAVALLLSLTRDVKAADSAVRDGAWERRNKVLRPLIFRKRIGILGLGDIGLGIARRIAGFEVTIAYHNRTRRDDVPYAYKPSVVELAKASDILVISCPGGAATRGLVDAAVIDALGPNGFIVNVARGTVVVTDDLVKALNEGRLAGAAIDVLDGEPAVSEAVLNAPNLIITPHVGSRSPESSAMALERVRDNLRAFFSGQPVVSRVL